MSYCDRCDLLVGLEGYHVVAVTRDGPALVVTIEAPPGPMGCPGCGVVALSHGRAGPRGRRHSLFRAGPVPGAPRPDRAGRRLFFLLPDTRESQVDRGASLVAGALAHKAAIDAERLPTDRAGRSAR